MLNAKSIGLDTSTIPVSLKIFPIITIIAKTKRLNLNMTVNLDMNLTSK